MQWRRWARGWSGPTTTRAAHRGSVRGGEPVQEQRAARGSAGVVAEAVGTEMAAAGLLAALSAVAVVLRSLNQMDRSSLSR